MLATLPTTASSRAAYLQEVATTLTQTAAIAELATLPWPLLALNATFYLDQYLTTAAYRAALTMARFNATAERQSWQSLPGDALAADELHGLIQASAPRPLLYRWLFDRALSTGNPAQFLLAQHAVEIAEVVGDQLESALHLGLIAVPREALAAVEPSASGLVPSAESIEQLSRALLRHRVTTRYFAESLLLIHAARRAAQLTGVTFAAPIALDDRAVAPALDFSSNLNRLRIMQCHDLAQRAVTSGDSLAIVTVEAGLVEAEELRGCPQLLLLAALDRATRG